MPKQRKETEPEKLVREELTMRGIEFIQEYPIKVKLDSGSFNYYIDFYLPWQAITIDVDGEYFHDLPGQKGVDFRKDGVLRLLGYKVVRLREDEVHADVQLAVDRALKEAH